MNANTNNFERPRGIECPQPCVEKYLAAAVQQYHHNTRVGKEGGVDYTPPRAKCLGECVLSGECSLQIISSRRLSPSDPDTDRWAVADPLPEQVLRAHMPDFKRNLPLAVKAGAPARHLHLLNPVSPASPAEKRKSA